MNYFDALFDDFTADYHVWVMNFVQNAMNFIVKFVTGIVMCLLMVMLILGGTGRLYGAFIGAVVYMVLEDHLSKLSPTFWQFGIGLMLVLAVLFARRGLLGLIEDVGRYLSKKRGKP